MTRVLLDTNVLIDFITERTPFFHSAEKIFLLCRNEDICGCIAAHSITNALYILRRNYTLDERREMLLGICDLFDIVGIDKQKLICMLENKDFSDLEDCLQSECAAEYKADFIITRNVKDFAASMVPVITPSEFLEQFVK